MATRKPMKKFKRYDDGGSVEEAAAKQRGLDISNKEAPVGFFERLRAGNIDQPGTEAYNRFGAGRGRDRGESVSVNQPMPAAPAAPAASSRPLSDDMYSDTGSSTGMGAAGTSQTVTPSRPMATKPVVPAKPAAPASPVPSLRDTGPYRGDLINKPSLNTNYSNEGRNKPAPAAPAKPSMDIPAMRDNAKAALADDPSALMMGGGAAAAAAALLAKTKLGKLGKMFKGANKSTGKDLVTTSPSKGPSYMGKADDDKAASAYDKLRKSSFVKKGDDVTDVTPKSTAMKQLGKPTGKKPLDESDTTGGAIGYKRGGKMKKYASGGMVSSASKRADGIATKGKTRCKIC